MSDSFSFDVFLSHGASDTVAVREVANRLRDDGLKVWFEEWALMSGDRGPAAVEKGLAGSRTMVLFVSANLSDSEWAQLEAGTFGFRDPTNTERRFMVVRLGEANVPGSLAQFLYIDWFPAERQVYTKLLEACRPPLVAEAEEGLPEKSIQLEYKVKISAFAFSPDGTRAFTGAADGTVRLWDLVTGRCLGVGEGHVDEVQSLSWSPDQTRVVSGGGFKDKTLRLWDVQTLKLLKVLEGHTSFVNDVAWSADGRSVVSGSSDNTLRLWDAETGECARVFKGHTDLVTRVIWSADGRAVVSGACDRTVRLWDVETGRCLRIFEGHSNYVTSLTWTSDYLHILSGSWDKTIRLWDLSSGSCLRVLEGHADRIDSLKSSPNGFWLLSSSWDQTVRVWNVATGECLGVLKRHKDRLVTADWTADGTRSISGDVAGGICVWDLSRVISAWHRPRLAALPARPDQIQYTNAKVLLVGDTGVGKSGLAERLVRDVFIATKSSHARKTYVLESTTVAREGDVTLHRETVLWDLAGQPAYRLVHQLSLEGAAIACVLFDNRNEANPFEGVAYWSLALDQARSRAQRILVASRIDVGGLPASRDRIVSFASEHGFVGFIPTSAHTGEGCQTLRETIQSTIQWDHLPTVTTEGPLAPLRAYVAGLKGENGRTTVSVKVFTAAQLHEGFVADYGRKIAFSEFISHLERLEDTDAVDILLFHSTGARARPETLVLLDPTRVDAYASALLVAAKDEPDGPGHLLESRVREMKFTLNAEERLADPESEKHVLWYAIENLLARDLALRERIKGQDYFVFPSQCTAEMRFPGVAAFGVAYSFSGPVRSVYARLIAQLAHFEGFKKREFFHDAAAYRPDEGGCCIVRLRDLGRGQGELELSFESETPLSVRQGFIEFVGNHLAERGTTGSVTRRHAYLCANPDCRKPFDDAVVQARLESRKKHLLCPYCEKKTTLVDLLGVSTAAAEMVAAQIVTDAKAGRQRMTAALVIRAKDVQGKFDIFLSYNSRDQVAVEKIARRLLSVGIRPWLDKWNMSPGDRIWEALEHAIKTIPCAALCFGPADTSRWHIMEIRAYVERWASGDARMIPVILPDVKEVPDLPLFVRQTLWVDMRDWEAPENDGLYRLVCGILGRPPGDTPAKKFGARDVAEWQDLGARK